MRTGEQGLEP